MCIDTVSLPNVSRYDDRYIDISLHLYLEVLRVHHLDQEGLICLVIFLVRLHMKLTVFYYYIIKFTVVNQDKYL